MDEHKIHAAKKGTWEKAGRLSEYLGQGSLSVEGGRPDRARMQPPCLVRPVSKLAGQVLLPAGTRLQP